jgi:hypothetical protein
MNEYICIDNDNILEPNINSITLINNAIFNKDLIESYKTEVDAIKQFTLDFNRETIYINCTIRNLLECVFSNTFLQTTHT